MAKASDCGSEDRGFESHYPPHKKRSTSRCFFFYGVWWVMGLERPAAAFAAVKTVRWTVFRPWESPAPQGASGSTPPQRTVFLLWSNGPGRERPAIGRAKKCPVDTFLARGRVPCASERTRMGVGGSAESGRCGQPARPGRRSVPLRLDNAVSLTVRLRCTRRCFFFYGIR